MKLLSTLLIASAALLSAVTSAESGFNLGADAQIDVSLIAPAPGELITWPRSAAGYRVRGNRGISNGERIKRGLAPSRPRKLYKAKAYKRLAKRIVDPPLVVTAQASGGPAKVYAFEACYTQPVPGTGFQAYSIVSTSSQDLADQCAAKQNLVGTGPGTIQGFFIVDRPNENCYVSVGPGGSAVTCTSGDNDAAYYRLQV